MRAPWSVVFLSAGIAFHATAVFSSDIRVGNSVTAPAAFDQSSVAIAASEDGMLAVWRDQRMGLQPFAVPVLFATRISPSGEILDPYGVRLSSYPAYEKPVVAWGGDSYLVIGTDAAVFYAQKVGRNGRPLHEPIRILGAGQYGEPLHLASNGNGYLFVWTHDDGTFAAWLDKDGAVMRTTQLHERFSLSSTLLVHRGVYYYFHSQLESLTVGTLRGAYLTTLRDDGAVEKQRIGDLSPRNLYLAAASNGDEIFVVLSDFQEFRSFSIRDAREPFIPRPFGGIFGATMHSRVAWDGSSFLVYWTKGANYTVTDVVGMRVDREGRAIDAAPVVLPPEASSFDAASFACAGPSCALVWNDQRLSEDRDVAGLVFDSFGDLFARSGEVRLISKSSRPQENVTFATDGDMVLAVWAEAGKPATIYGAFVRAGGDPGVPFPIATTEEKEVHDLAVAYGAGVYVVLWEERSSGWTQLVKAARVSTRGEVLDPTPRPLGASLWSFDDLALASDGTSFVTAWRGGQNAIFVAHLDAALAVKPVVVEMPRGLNPQPNIPPPDTSIYRANPRAVFDGTDFVVAWSEHRNHRDVFSHLRVLRISAGGALLGESTSEEAASALVARRGEVVALRSGTCLSAKALGGAREVTIACGTGESINWISAIPFRNGYVAAWMSYMDGQYDVHAARFTLDGEVEPFDLDMTAENERRPALIPQRGSVLFGYERVEEDEGFVPRVVLRVIRASVSRIER